MKIHCENKFCAYFNESNCKLNIISLNESGVCERIVYVDIDEELLSLKRNKLQNKQNQSNKIY